MSDQLIAQQVGKKIKLVWTYEPPAVGLQLSFNDVVASPSWYWEGTTNTEIANIDGIIYITWVADYNVGIYPIKNGIQQDYLTQGGTVLLDEGDTIAFKIVNFSSRPNSGTVTLKNDDEDGGIIDTFAFRVGGIQ